MPTTHSPPHSQAIVLLSGGQDSATCLAIAKENHRHVSAISIDYGQRHRIELDCAKQLADRANIPHHIIKTDLFTTLTTSALTDTSLSVCDTHPTTQLPLTFVPGRNLLLLQIAAIYAYQQTCQTLYIGVCETDYSGYPDCRAAFIQATETAINLALDSTLSIKTPLMHLSKAQTVQTMVTLGHLDWYRHTHTCYNGDRPACGVCPACHLRLNGFKQAGIKDPIAYAATTPGVGFE